MASNPVDAPLVITFPGKYGDLLWALPTIRALMRRREETATLLLPEKFGDIADLLMLQPYIDSVITYSGWRMQDTAPISPRIPPQAILEQFKAAEFLHLGYRDWPLPNVLLHTLETLNGNKSFLDAVGVDPILESELDLDTPWITVDGDEADLEGMAYTETPWIAGFTDEYFELKFGLWSLLTKHRPWVGNSTLALEDCRPEFFWEQEERSPLSISQGARWKSEGFHGGCNWLDGAYWLSKTEAFLGDCSAWHVLAAAMGVPVVLMEPQEMRHNPVFYPLPERQVFLVKGNDGKPTFDARHVAEALTSAIQWSRVNRTLEAEA